MAYSNNNTPELPLPPIVNSHRYDNIKSNKNSNIIFYSNNDTSILIKKVDNLDEIRYSYLAGEVGIGAIIYGYYQDDHNNIFMVMEKINGTIFKNLSKQQKTSYENNILATVQLLASHGIFNYDIHYEDVIIDTNDKVRIIDYGLVKYYDDALITPGIKNSIATDMMERLYPKKYQGSIHLSKQKSQNNTRKRIEEKLKRYNKRANANNNNKTRKINLKKNNGQYKFIINDGVPEIPLLDKSIYAIDPNRNSIKRLTIYHLLNSDFDGKLVGKLVKDYKEIQMSWIAGIHNIGANIIGYYKDKSEYYMIMEFIDGTIFDELSESDKLRYENDIYTSIRKLLVEAGIKYYDMHGENIIITSDSNVKIIDYDNVDYYSRDNRNKFTNSQINGIVNMVMNRLYKNKYKNNNYNKEIQAYHHKISQIKRNAIAEKQKEMEERIRQKFSRK